MWGTTPLERMQRRSNARAFARRCTITPREDEVRLQGALPEPGEPVRALRAEGGPGGAVRLRRGRGDPLRQPGRRARRPVGGAAEVRVRRRQAHLHPATGRRAHRRGREGGDEQDRLPRRAPGERDPFPDAAREPWHETRQGLRGTPTPYLRFFRIRSTAATTSSRLPKADSRKNPSPDGPNPLPGVPTTLHSASRRSKKSHEEIPPGVFSQI